MNEEIKNNYLDSGTAVKEAKQKAQEICQVGTSYREIADKLESVVSDHEGVEPAFPVNISANEEAAHYSPGPNTDRVVQPGDLLKVDIGAHKDGYIADSAITVDVSDQHSKIRSRNEEILSKALERIEPGLTVGELGSYIGSLAEDYNIITNLTGHYLDRYTQHAGVSIPNRSNGSDHVFKKGDVFAVEPFLTDGPGRVRNGKPGNIYKQESNANVRGRRQRKLLGEIKELRGLPFSPRWLDSYNRMAMAKLVQSGVVKHYDILVEDGSGIVSQAEQTVMLTEDGSKIVTTN